MWAVVALLALPPVALARDVAVELASPKASSRAAAVKAIDKLPPEKLGVVDTDAPALEKALADPDPAIRAATARLVEKVGMKALWPALVPRLADPDAGVRDAATSALSAGWPETRDELLSELHGGSAENKRATLVFLKTRPPDPILVREALPALADADPGVSAAAADLVSAAGGMGTWEAIAQLGDAPLKPKLLVFLADRDVSDDPATFPRWTPEPQMWELLQIITEIDDPPLLLRLADNKSEGVRNAAVAALVRNLDEAAVDPKVPLNLQVFKAVGDRGQLHANHVTRALTSTGFGVWEEAVKRAQPLGDPSLIPVLVETTGSHKEKAATVLDVVTALDPAWPARITDPAVSAHLTAILSANAKIPAIASCAWCQAWMAQERWRAEVAKGGTGALAEKAKSEAQAATETLQHFPPAEAHQGGQMMWIREHQIGLMQAEQANITDPGAAAVAGALIERAKNAGRVAR